MLEDVARIRHRPRYMRKRLFLALFGKKSLVPGNIARKTWPSQCLGILCVFAVKRHAVLQSVGRVIAVSANYLFSDAANHLLLLRCFSIDFSPTIDLLDIRT